jgi:hypothetical protein
MPATGQSAKRKGGRRKEKHSIYPSSAAKYPGAPVRKPGFCRITIINKAVDAGDFLPAAWSVCNRQHDCCQNDVAGAVFRAGVYEPRHPDDMETINNTLQESR